MKSIKKLAILLIVLGVAVLMGRCALEETGDKQNTEQSVEVNKAKTWFEQYQLEKTFYTAFRNQVYDWDNASTETFENGSEAIVVPVKDKNLSDAYIGQKVLYLYALESKKGFSATLYEILPLSESLEKIKTSGDLVDFDGYIIAWDLETGFVNGAKFENSKATAALTTLRIISSEELRHLNKSVKSLGDIELEEVIIRRERSSNKEEYGGGGGGSYGGGLGWGSSGRSPKGYVRSPGGGGGGGNSSIISSIKVSPPSCESFNFTSKKGANWQEALVKNVQFKIVLLTPPNHIEITQIINYPQSISFGMPINFNKGNIDVTPGVAATVSAKILEKVMHDVVSKYGKTEASELTVRLYFQQQLIKEYREYSNGGVVNFNSNSSIKATQYKTNISSTGNCD